MLLKVSKYVKLAFDIAGDLVKTLTVSEIVKGDFDPLTGKHQSTTKTFQVRALDVTTEEQRIEFISANKFVRVYIFLSPDKIRTNQKFSDDGKDFRIIRAESYEQNSTNFVYQVWAEA